MGFRHEDNKRMNESYGINNAGYDSSFYFPIMYFMVFQIRLVDDN